MISNKLKCDNFQTIKKTKEFNCGKFYNQISKATFKPKTSRQILRQKPTK